METVEDVSQSIPHIYATLANKQENHQAYIIEMGCKICDQVISILIDPRSSYNYVSTILVEKCGLSKELHAESYLVQLATVQRSEFIIG